MGYRTNGFVGDLKPENVLMMHGTPLLMDFGSVQEAAKLVPVRSRREALALQES